MIRGIFTSVIWVEISTPSVQSRHAENQPTARTQNAPDLFQTFHIMVEMFEYVEQQHGLKFPVLPGERLFQIHRIFIHRDSRKSLALTPIGMSGCATPEINNMPLQPWQIPIMPWNLYEMLGVDAPHSDR